MALQEHEINALKSENKSLRIKLGLAEKKIDKLQKKIDELQALKQSWFRKSEEDEKKKRMFFERMREAQEAKLDIEKNVYKELQELEVAFGDRMKYLMSKTGSTFEESDAKKWCEENANMLLIGHFKAEDGNITWELKEAEEVEDGSEDIPEEE